MSHGKSLIRVDVGAVELYGGGERNSTCAKNRWHDMTARAHTPITTSV